MAYPTVEDLIGDASEPQKARLEALSVDEAEALLVVAIAGIEGWAGQTFTQEGTEGDPVVKLADGSGTDRLFLPKRLAIVTGVTLDGHLLAPADYVLEPGGRALRMVNPIGGSWVTRVRRHPSDPAPVWDAGALNVSVAGVWGWTDDEWEAGELALIRTALRFDMEDHVDADANELADTVRQAQALGLSSISQGNMSLSFRAGAGSAAPMISTRVRRHLAGLTPSGYSLKWGALPSGAVV